MTRLPSVILVAALATPLTAQTPAAPAQAPKQTPAPPAQTPKQTPAPGQTTPRPAARGTTRPVARIVVRDASGTSIAGATVAISGAGAQSLTTDASGTATAPLAAGTYRLRFDHDGFLTLERDITVRAGQPAEIDVVLDRAPTPPAPEPPPLPAK